MAPRVKTDAAPRSARHAPRPSIRVGRGRFVVRHDRAHPTEWELALEVEGDLVAFRLRGPLPSRPHDRRGLARVDQGDQPPERDARVRDEGRCLVERRDDRTLLLAIEGRNLRGRYLLEEEGEDEFAIERLDPESLRPMPALLLPMLARTSDYPRDEHAYAFEVKWDGIRALVHLDRGKLVVRSRNLADITIQYPELRAFAERFPDRQLVLDGEIVAFDERGLPSFQRLQSRLGITSREVARKRSGEVPVVYMVFDVLYVDGHETTALPYEERRALLESLDLAGANVHVSPAFVADGRALLSTPGLEGIVAKRLGSKYEPGARSSAWLKIKATKRQEFVIAGWTPGKGSRGGRIGALLVGVYDKPHGEKLLYAGSVGTGFSERTLDELHGLFAPHARATSPFAGAIDKKGARFVEPRFVGEVEFTEWTREGRLRHPSFKGLRDDKDPKDVVREDA